MYQCARDSSISLPHLAATQLLKETIPFNNKHVTLFLFETSLLSHVLKRRRAQRKRIRGRKKELISTYDNCRTFVRCITRGRVILSPL